MEEPCVEEILSDHGTQFVSDYMKKANHMLTVK